MCADAWDLLEYSGMIALRKRGQHFHVDYVAGSARVRGSLGVSDPKSAKRLANRLGFALADGPNSRVWDEIQPILPERTWVKFSVHAGVAPRSSATWENLVSIFWKEKERGWAAST